MHIWYLCYIFLILNFYFTSYNSLVSVLEEVMCDAGFFVSILLAVEARQTHAFIHACEFHAEDSDSNPFSLIGDTYQEMFMLYSTVKNIKKYYCHNVSYINICIVDLPLMRLYTYLCGSEIYLLVIISFVA